MARFCPKCAHLKVNADRNVPVSSDLGSSGRALPEKVPFSKVAFQAETYSCDELLRSEFKPLLDEAIVLHGRTFFVKGIFNILDGYAYLTSKRYVLCDASGVNIVFQMGCSSILSVKSGRHLVSKKIVVTTVSGEVFQVKSQAHFRWINALLEQMTFAAAPGKENIEAPENKNGTLDWYYENNGVKIGPVKESIIVQLIRNNHTIYRNTKVWNSSLPEWKPAEETILTIYFGSFDSTNLNIFRPGFLHYVKLLCLKYL